jgi:hypothetical protein
MTNWSEGDRCVVVEHDDAGGPPKQGGQVLPATVEYMDQHGFVFADIPELGRAIAFRADTGRAFGSNSGWRLVKACQATGTPSGTVCGKPSAGLYRAACAHGHVRERRLCTGHASSEEGLWCRACFELDGAGSHVCDVTPVPVTEAVARVTMPGREEQ